MKRWRGWARLAGFLALLPWWAPPAGATIINLDTLASGASQLDISVIAKRAGAPWFFGSPANCPCEAGGGGLMDVRFDSGIYTSTLIFGAQSDWFAGPGTGGNRTSYSVGIGADTSIGTAAQPGAGNSFLLFQGGEPNDFANTTDKVETFTIFSQTVLSFGVTDVQITDNTGGITLRLAKIGDVVVTEPAALGLFGLGLAGLGAMRRRRRAA